MRLADVMQRLKSASSRWIHEELELAGIVWQQEKYVEMLDRGLVEYHPVYVGWGQTTFPASLQDVLNYIAGYS
ncbi:hypothetical protein WJU23_07940 [Prosthecobacter sp. SYSU 5D2]|uniref:hypothetical protein n=1 Tax=Prosthecobacter sp. SYSU 5D2 TaxID=3134134 RepID=UPI0031FEF09B